MRIKPSALFDLAPRHVCRAAHSFPLSAPLEGCSPAFLIFFFKQETDNKATIIAQIRISFRVELQNGLMTALVFIALRRMSTAPQLTADLSEAFCKTVPLYFQTDFEKDVDIACRSGKERPRLKLAFCFCSILQK